MVLMLGGLSHAREVQSARTRHVVFKGVSNEAYLSGLLRTHKELAVWLVSRRDRKTQNDLVSTKEC